MLALNPDSFHRASDRPLIPASFPLGRLWFAVFVSPFEVARARAERSERYGNWFPIEDRICDLGFETFVPLERRNARRNGRKFTISTPLFGQYVFVAFNPEVDQDWPAINHTQGVLGIISDMDIPTSIPTKVIDYFRRAEANGVFDYTKPQALFREGEDVEIVDGPFAGLVAKVRSCEPKKRVKLLLKGLGKLDIDPACLVRR